ncbi:hypothetical protein QF026_002187 [Streptomyces aurantiacus]|nr:hypothetical protein [Streptomyces aurantiacus]
MTRPHMPHVTRLKRRHAHLPALGVALLLLLAACAVTDTGPEPAGPPAAGPRDSASAGTAVVHVYFYSAQGLERVSRPYRGPDATGAALRELASGPDAAERARGLISYAPAGAPAPVGTAQQPGSVRVFALQGWESRSALRQLVCTAADAASTAQGTSLRTFRVKVRQVTSGDPVTVTRVCTL